MPSCLDFVEKSGKYVVSNENFSSGVIRAKSDSARRAASVGEADASFPWEKSEPSKTAASAAPAIALAMGAVPSKPNHRPGGDMQNPIAIDSPLGHPSSWKSASPLRDLAFEKLNLSTFVHGQANSP
jgi:hypothetical protein